MAASQDESLKFKSGTKMGKKGDLGDFGWCYNDADRC